MPDPVGEVLLLDTHIWIWVMAGGSPLLSRRAREEIDRVGRTGTLLMSAISVWETALLEARGRVTLRQPVTDWVEALLRGPGVRLLPLHPDIAIDSTRLPDDPHADPADRILMASARITGARLVTCDSRIIRYAGAGHLAVLDARP